MPRIGIIGPSGTGKTTLCKLLAEQLNYPIYTLSLRYYPKSLKWEDLIAQAKSQIEEYQYQAALWIRSKQLEYSEEWSSKPNILLDRIGVVEVVLYSWYLNPELKDSKRFQDLLTWGNEWVIQNLDAIILLRYLDSYEDDPYRPSKDFRLMELYYTWVNSISLPVLDLPSWSLEKRAEESIDFIAKLS